MLKRIYSMFSLTSSERDEIRHEINLFKAIEAHSAWKKRLHDYIAGSSGEDLQPLQVGVDNLCELGKWIYGPGREHFEVEPLFRQLEEEHAQFHVQAARVVEAYQAGKGALAEKLLAEDFTAQSRKTVNCLVKINVMVEGQRAEE
ncbi:MAG TPA: CZB domain-containing protein [Gallionellaceae bacterium]